MDAKDLGAKNDAGKLRFDLIPVRSLEEVAGLYTMGAKKYADRNWEKGLSWSRCFAAMMRHAWAFWRGETFDKEDGQHHMASVAWYALAFIEYEYTHPELDDRPTISFTKEDIKGSFKLNPPQTNYDPE